MVNRRKNKKIGETKGIIARKRLQSLANKINEENNKKFPATSAQKKQTIVPVYVTLPLKQKKEIKKQRENWDITRTGWVVLQTFGGAIPFWKLAKQKNNEGLFPDIIIAETEGVNKNDYPYRKIAIWSNKQLLQEEIMRVLNKKEGSVLRGKLTESEYSSDYSWTISKKGDYEFLRSFSGNGGTSISAEEILSTICERF